MAKKYEKKYTDMLTYSLVRSFTLKCYTKLMTINSLHTDKQQCARQYQLKFLIVDIKGGTL